jgi:cytochrome c oxidase assembly protein subunit 15
VTLSTVALLVGARRRRPNRPDLVRLSWGLVAGTLTQILLGGVTVLADLAPLAVSSHFLVSMALLWVAQLLWIRADPDGPAPPLTVADDLTNRLLRLQLPLATVVLATGTLVTGSGPNSGDSRADRLDLELGSVARIHSVSVWLLAACLVALAVRLAIRPNAIVASGPPAGGDGGHGGARASRGLAGLAPASIVRIMVAVVVAQGAVGYTQFAMGVPAGLVEIHVVGAVLVWLLAVALQLRVFDRPPSEADRSEPAEAAARPGPRATGVR